MDMRSIDKKRAAAALLASAALQAAATPPPAKGGRRPVGKMGGRNDARLVAMPDAPVKAGRNEPCPCGSGKKFKRCCRA